MNRRKFIKNSLYTAVGLGVSTAFYSWQIEPFLPEFTQINMDVANLPIHLEGKKLMQISDLHVGNRFDYNYLIKSFQKAAKYKPDFVVYTGDFVSYENEKQFRQLSEVMHHAVKGKFGTVAILGNHDYGENWEEENVALEICKVLQKAEIDVLRNEQKSYNELNFIGIDDYWSNNFFPDLAFRNYDSTKANVVLCHNPDVCDLDVWHNYQGWILSGHTHGGQCKAPFLPPPILPVKNKKYTNGKFNLKNNRKLYINRAIGHSIQVRFNVRPEITIFTLKGADL